LAPQQELGLWPQWRDRLDIGNRIDSPIGGRDIAAISDGAEVGADGWSNRKRPVKTSRTWRRATTFPANLPSHCKNQVFHFAPGGELLRLDYTAEVVGGWANAAHLKNPLPFPTLVAIDVQKCGRCAGRSDEASGGRRKPFASA
jgi:hypothetical protein